jgi:hypothetical protein
MVPAVYITMRMRWPMISVALLGCCVPLLSGCLGGGTAGQTSQPIGSSPAVPQPPTLHIQIRDITAHGGSRVVQAWTLGCSLPSGSKPQPKTTCRALRDYARNYIRPYGTCHCSAPLPGMRWAVIYGELDGKRFQANLSNCMCGYSRRMVYDLYLATGLRDTVQVLGLPPLLHSVSPDITLLSQRYHPDLIPKNERGPLLCVRGARRHLATGSGRT